MTHAHEWAPILMWPGRYRCTTPGCGALGYRAVVTPQDIARSDKLPEAAILAYVCVVPDCERAAVTYRPRQRCRQHACKARGRAASP